MSTMNVLDSVGATVAVEKPLIPGQALMAASRPVVIASDQSAVPISAASLPLPTGGATSANQTALNALFPASLGTKTAAASLAVTLASDGVFAAAIGATSDAAVANGAAGTALGYLRSIKDAATDTTTPSPVKIDQTTPGTTNAVSIQQPCDMVPLTPVLDTSVYASGDTLFVTTALAGAVRANDQRALLQSLVLIDKAKNNPAMTLFFFKSNVTFGTINVAPSLSDADAVNCLGYITIAAADWVTLANNSICTKTGINLLLESAAGTTTVYVAAMLNAGTPTYAASDLVLNYGLVFG